MDDDDWLFDGSASNGLVILYTICFVFAIGALGVLMWVCLKH